MAITACLRVLNKAGSLDTGEIFSKEDRCEQIKPTKENLQKRNYYGWKISKHHKTRSSIGDRWYTGRVGTENVFK